MKLRYIFIATVLFFGCSESSFKSTQSESPVVIDPPVIPTVEETSKDLDLLLIVDDSGSMLEDNQKLAGYLGDLVTELNLDEVDWQMCITTTDVDYYEGRTILWRDNNDSNVITPLTSNINSIFTNTINWIGHGWSDDEQGIKAMNMALKESANSDCFRDGAALSIILISDEDERSVGGVESLSSSQYKELGDMNSPYIFMDTVFEKFGSAKRVIAHSIIVDEAECKTEQDDDGETESFIGTQYKKLSEITRGKVISICDAGYLLNLDFFGDTAQDPLDL